MKIQKPSAAVLRIVTQLAQFGLFVLLCLLAADSIGNPASTTKILTFPAYYLVVPYLVCLLAVKLFWGVSFHSLIKKFLLVITLGLYAVVALLSIYWFNSYENAVFELTRLHPEGLTIIWLTVSCSWLIVQTSEWWKKHWAKTIFILPFVAYSILYFISLWHFNIFAEIVKEDKIIEYLQFWVLLSAGALQLVKAFHLLKKKDKLLAVIHGVVGLAFIAVAGDEVSWGQRLLGFEVSEEIEKVNRQGEVTFHNLYAVEWLVIYAYVCASIFGLVSHWLLSIIRPLHTYQKLVPSPVLLGYFILPAIFFIQQIRVENGIWHLWSEVAELYLYAGLGLWWVMMKWQSVK